MIKFQFVLGTGLSSQAIAWFSAGHFSHVDAVLPDGRLLGARSDSVGGKPPGVQIRPPAYENWKERVVMALATTNGQSKIWENFLTDQIGKPYDKTAILGFASGRDWREQDSWFCSELGCAACEKAKICPKLYAPASKITPAAFATILSALGASVS